MAKDYDLVIRGGVIADGSGAPLYEGDIGVKNGRFAAIERRLSGAGADEIDARGKLVTPGFVDVHTHYDGQATWSSRMQPSSWHGVTTVVMGNCGVGFAPCKAEHRDTLTKLMEGIEDIPYPILAEGLTWDWESFPDYLDVLAQGRFDVDIGAQVPHAALRVFVMGERGAAREPAGPDDIAAMAALAREAIEAGAFGFSTTRSINHRASDGNYSPTMTAAEEELISISRGVAAAGRGVLQIITDFVEPEADFVLLQKMAQAAQLPLSFSLGQSSANPQGWRATLAALERANADGLHMKAQVAARAIGVLYGLELTLNPFSLHETYRRIAAAPLAERVAALSDPSFRAALFAEPAPSDQLWRRRLGAWDRLYPIEALPNYEPTQAETVAARAARAGVEPIAFALDHLISNGGRGLFYFPAVNYVDGALDSTRAMLTHKDTIPGLGDGGAHVGMICDGSFPTTLLTHWTRDRTRGPKLTIEQVVRMQTRDTAEAVGLHDRGRLMPGLRADLNVIDYDGLCLLAPEVSYDLPAGGRRLVQRARGYTATLVAGEVTYREGEATDALPGRLMRSGARA